MQALRFGWRHDAEPLLALDHLVIARGERLFVGGRSGSGKSTLLGLAAGVTRPWSGKVRVLGQDLFALSAGKRDAFRADHVGIVFQLFNLVVYLDALENVLLPCRFSRRRRARLAERGLEPRAEARRLLERLELDVPSISNRPVTELSIGQQQRVALARALIGGPELLIADEPTSALDSDTRDRFVELLFNETRASGCSLLFVSHDLALASHFEHRLTLSESNGARTTVQAPASALTGR